MEDRGTRKVHWSFWLIGIVALIWNLMGSINFFAQMNPEVLAAYRESERAIVEGRPAWATAGFAIAVFGGTLGCVLLLLKRSAAYHLFIVSLLGVLVTMAHTLGVGIDFSLGEVVGIILLPTVVAAFLIWFARRVQSQGWIT